MIRDRRFAFAFRLGALLFAIVGLMKQIGIFNGTISGKPFMYYTIQSNMLVIVLFAMLVIRTGKNLREIYGVTGWYARFEMICVVDVLITLIVFWLTLASQIDAKNLWTFENLAIHMITPLLCFMDYIFFSWGCHLKYRDVYFACIFPISYVIFTIIAMLLGYVYSLEGSLESAFSSTINMTPVRVPYFFFDYNRIGVMVVVYIVMILILIILLGHGLYFANRKSENRSIIKHITPKE